MVQSTTSAGAPKGATSSTAASVSTTTLAPTLNPQPWETLRTGQSQQGAYLERSVWLECAHHLPNHPGKCRYLHGHTYELTVEVFGHVTPSTGMVVDFHDLDGVLEGLEDLYDHKDLNVAIPDILPTAENLANLWLAQLRGWAAVEMPHCTVTQLKVKEGHGGVAIAR